MRPASPMPIYLAGAKVIGLFAYGPTIGASLNITLISWETAAIGINIDTSTAPDYDVLLGCLRERFGEIIALGDDSGSPAPG
jgi:diacylglycerol O-acyltransferase